MVGTSCGCLQLGSDSSQIKYVRWWSDSRTAVYIPSPALLRFVSTAKVEDKPRGVGQVSFLARCRGWAWQNANLTVYLKEAGADETRVTQRDVWRVVRQSESKRHHPSLRIMAVGWKKV